MLAGQGFACEDHRAAPTLVREPPSGVALEGGNDATSGACANPFAAALAIVASIGMLATTTPAGAVDYTTCNSVSGLNLSGQQDSVVAGCTGPTGGSGVFAGPVSSPMTVNWAGGGTTTISFTTKVHKKTSARAGRPRWH